MRAFAAAALSIAAVSNAAAGQTGPVEVGLPPAFTGAAPLDPPRQTGAWVLQVISRGGLSGRGTGDLTIKSDGTAALVAPVNGAASVHPDALASLNQRIRSVGTAGWAVNSRLGVCSDCTATLIVLSVREPNGLVRTYTAFWDATTTAGIPEDLRRIHDLAVTVQQR